MVKRIRSPHFPQLAQPASLRAWLNSPKERALRERTRRLHDALETSPTKPPRGKRKHAGGAPPKLTPEEVALLRATYREAEPAIRRRECKQSDVFDDLRELLPKNKRGISDPTLRRLIIRPLRRK
jgi:hypothetical protein